MSVSDDTNFVDSSVCSVEFESDDMNMYIVTQILRYRG